MTLKDASRAVGRRIRHPGYWATGAALLLFVLPGLPFHVRDARYEVLLVAWITLWTMGMLVLAPFPWQWTGNARPMAGFIRGAAQALLLLSCLSALLLGLRLIPHPPPSLSPAPVLLAVGLTLSLMAGLPGGYILARAEQQAAETRASQARAREIAWMSQRGAFSPALLLTNLGHLAGQADRDPRATERGLVDLATLYRQWLLEAQRPWIPWATELDLAERYLDLEIRRWGSALAIRWHLDPDADAHPVPPLLLLPILETALAAGPGGGPVDLELSVGLRGSALALAVEVRSPAAPPDEAILSALRERLDGGPEALCMTRGEEGWGLRLLLARPGEGSAP